METGGYLDLEGGNRICMVLEWTLGLKRPGSILVSAATSQGNMGDSEPPCESCACIIHTNIGVGMGGGGGGGGGGFQPPHNFVTVVITGSGAPP